MNTVLAISNPASDAQLGLLRKLFVEKFDAEKAAECAAWLDTHKLSKATASDRISKLLAMPTVNRPAELDEGMYKVGELAQRAGVSVRTLHHYEAIGLLVPSARSASDHRLYAAKDLERLVKITALTSLGFSLEQVRTMLDEPSSTAELVEQHVLGGQGRAFPVTAGQELLGLVTLTDLKAVPRDQWQATTVYRAMTPMSKLHTVGPRDELRTVLAVAGLFNIFFFLYPGPLVSIATTAAKSLF